MKGKFKTDLTVSPSIGDNWQLRENLIYISNNGDAYTVPKNFITDLASIPRVIRSIFAVNSKHRQAAVLHDYLYTKKHISRKMADELFYEAMINSNVTKWKAKLFYYAVRIGGGFARKV